MLKKKSMKKYFLSLLSVGAMLTQLSATSIGSPKQALAADGGAAGLTVSSLAPKDGGWKVATDAGTVIQRAITIVIVAGALVALYYLIMGAIGWITSDGEASKVESARNKMLYAVIGLLVLASVWAIYRLVLTLAFNTTDVKFVSISG